MQALVLVSFVEENLALLQRTRPLDPVNNVKAVLRQICPVARRPYRASFARQYGSVARLFVKRLHEAHSSSTEDDELRPARPKLAGIDEHYPTLAMNLGAFP